MLYALLSASLPRATAFPYTLNNLKRRRKCFFRYFLLPVYLKPSSSCVCCDYNRIISKWASTQNHPHTKKLYSVHYLNIVTLFPLSLDIPLPKRYTLQSGRAQATSRISRGFLWKKKFLLPRDSRSFLLQEFSRLFTARWIAKERFKGLELRLLEVYVRFISLPMATRSCLPRSEYITDHLTSYSYRPFPMRKACNFLLDRPCKLRLEDQ